MENNFTLLNVKELSSSWKKNNKHLYCMALSQGPAGDAEAKGWHACCRLPRRTGRMAPAASLPATSWAREAEGSVEQGAQQKQGSGLPVIFFLIALHQTYVNGTVIASYDNLQKLRGISLKIQGWRDKEVIDPASVSWCLLEEGSSSTPLHCT